MCVFSYAGDAFLVESTEALGDGNGDGVFGVSADSVTVDGVFGGVVAVALV